MGGDHEGTLDLGKGQHATSLRCARGIATLARMRSATSHSAHSTSPTPSSGSRRATTGTRRSGRCARSRRARLLRRVGVRGQPVPDRVPATGRSTRYEDVWTSSRNPQLFCSGRGRQHRRHAAGDQRVLRLDDHDGRPEHFRLRSPSSPRASRRRRSARSRTTCAPRPPAIVDRLLEQFPDGECDFVERGRRAAPAADHLRDDGHPGRGRGADLRLDQRHPRRRRPRVRRLVRRADGRCDGDVRVRPGAGRGPPAPTPATTSPR